MEQAPVQNQTRYEVSPEELERIIAEAAIERTWLEGIPPVQTDAEVTELVESGVAERVPDSGTGYHISPGVPELYRVLRPPAKAMLETIAALWLESCQAQGLRNEYYLRITSLARPVAYEQALQAKGYPIAGEGSHTRLMAFDILVSWLQTHAPNEFGVLEQQLQRAHQAGIINLVHEPSVGVYHVCVRP